MTPNGDYKSPNKRYTEWSIVKQKKCTKSGDVCAFL